MKDGEEIKADSRELNSKHSMVFTFPILYGYNVSSCLLTDGDFETNSSILFLFSSLAIILLEFLLNKHSVNPPCLVRPSSKCRAEKLVAG